MEPEGRPWLWWTLVAVLAAAQAVPTLVTAEEAPGDPGASREMRAMARYAVGLHRMDPKAGAEALRGLERLVRHWSDHVRLVAVEGEILGAQEARARVRKLTGEGPPEPWVEDLRALDTIYADGPGALAGDARVRLRERHGWYADLALGHGLPDTDPHRRDALAPAVRTAVALTFGGLAGLVGLTVGVVLLILWARRRLGRTWTDALRPLPRRAGDIALLETVAIFLVALLATSTLVPLALVAGLGIRPGAWIRLLPWLALCALGWPRARGFGADRWKRDLGLHRGAGVLPEIGCGLLGYLAALPLLGLGLLASTWLARALGLDPSHPLVEEAVGGSRLELAALYGMACLWAPLAEEACFRGALYRYLRGRWRPAASALLVALVFAALHPQGVGGIPVLAAIAFAFGLIREWRGSLVACVTAHLVHNLVFITLGVLVMR